MPRRTPLVCYDDARARRFEPFALTRPWSEMRVGALLVRERWEIATGAQARGFVAGVHMQNFREEGAPKSVGRVVRAGTTVANSRCAVLLDTCPAESRVYRCDGRVAAVTLTRDEPAARFVDGFLTLDAIAREHHPRVRGHTMRGAWCDEVWDVIRLLPALLNEDIPQLAHEWQCVAADADRRVNTTIMGAHPVWLEGNAHIEPHTVFDTTAGPVLLRAGSVVQAFSRITGPCSVGQRTTVSGGRIATSSFGEQCKVQGEVSSTVFIGHANKGHDGFVGHSVLGRWVNLGAGTTTSNLKNTYGSVALWTPDGVRDTGLQFLGTLFGDHVKTGIGLRLTTGCVLGAGANVVDRMPPKAVEPFAWGSGAPYAHYDADKFLDTATRVMSRRSVELDDTMRRHLRAAHTRRWTLG